jgi:hypothetical protein
MKKQTCPCCGYKTLEERNNWETCPVCRWMDDSVQSFRPHLGGDANKESLVEAQRNFREIGRASKNLFKSHRAPISDYEKDKNWMPFDEK